MAALGVGEYTQVLTIVGTGLTTAYTANRVALPTYGATAVNFTVDYTKGGETGAFIQVEVYDADLDAWSVLPFNEATLVAKVADAVNLDDGSLYVSATGSYRFIVPKILRTDTQIRVSARSDGSANGTTRLNVKANLNSTKVTVRS
jgi:hypothetical protein